MFKYGDLAYSKSRGHLVKIVKKFFDDGYIVEVDENVFIVLPENDLEKGDK